MSALQTFAAIQRATLAARAATGMKGIGTQMGGGLFQVVNVTPRPRRSAIVDPLSDFLPAEQAIEVLNQIAADGGFR